METAHKENHLKNFQVQIVKVQMKSAEIDGFIEYQKYNNTITIVIWLNI